MAKKNENASGFDFDDFDTTLESTGNEVKMGDVSKEGAKQEVIVEDEGELLQEKEEGVKSEKEKSVFKDFVGALPHVVLDKKEIAHFLDLASYHARLNYDVYTMSFKLDTERVEEGVIGFVYNNGTVLAMSDVNVVTSSARSNEGKMGSFIVSVDTMLKVYSASSGYVYLFEEDGNLYSWVFGGRVYIETFRVDTDICAKDYLISMLSTKSEGVSKIDPMFVSTLKGLYDVVRSGSRIEEKALYFEGAHTYIYSGIVMGKFKGIGLDITLQDVDISTLARYFFDAKEAITLEDYGSFFKYTYGSRRVYLAKRGFKLDSDMRFIDTVSKDSVSCEIGDIQKVVNFLSSMSNNTGLVTLSNSSNGLVMSCQQKALDYVSEFPIMGTVIGKGVGTVRVPLDILKTFTRIFTGKVTIQTENSKTYISSAAGSIVIFGSL
jgi:hypothetical protein